MIFVDTIKEDDEDEHLTNGTTKYQAITTTESIEFDNGLKLDLSSADDELTNRNHNRQSVDSDLEAIKRSKAKVGEWQTNFTLTESKVNFVYLNLTIKLLQSIYFS